MARQIKNNQRSVDALPGGVRAVKVLQLHRTYLVVEDEAGMVVIDQHALA